MTGSPQSGASTFIALQPHARAASGRDNHRRIHHISSPSSIISYMAEALVLRTVSATGEHAKPRQLFAEADFNHVALLHLRRGLGNLAVDAHAAAPSPALLGATVRRLMILETFRYLSNLMAITS